MRLRSHLLVNRRTFLSSTALLIGSRGIGASQSRAAGDATYRDLIDATLVDAFGAAADWDPNEGFRANRDRLVACYDYYRTLYLRDPERFLWAGLARLVGAAVIRGLDTAVRGLGAGVRGQPDPSLFTVEMVTLVKRIFTTLVWQHEAILGVPGLALTLLEEFDRDQSATNSYRDLWSQVVSAKTTDEVVSGNLLLMMNEQFDLVQPVFGVIGRSDPRFAAALSLFSGVVHPYHRSFLDIVPDGNITNVDERWAWITGSEGLWMTWVQIPQAERTRLVSLDLNTIAAHDWQPILPEFVPTT